MTFYKIEPEDARAFICLGLFIGYWYLIYIYVENYHPKLGKNIFFYQISMVGSIVLTVLTYLILSWAF